MGAQNQQKINRNLNTATQSVNAIKNCQGRNRNANYQQSCKGFTRFSTVPQNYQYTSFCTTSGLRWSHSHRQICPATGKKCNNCGIAGHFSRKCRKPKKQQSQTTKALQTNVNQIDTAVEKSDDEESVKYITSYQQLYNQFYDSSYDSDPDVQFSKST